MTSRFCGLFYEAAGNSTYQVLRPYNGTEEYTDTIVRFTKGIGKIKHCELTGRKHVWNLIRAYFATISEFHRDSSVSVVTRQRAERSAIPNPSERDTFLFSMDSGPTLESSQSPIRWVSRFHPGGRTARA